MDFDDGLSLGGGGFGGGFGQSSSFGKAKDPPKVPVSILCGFLGAGKTTMVRHILRNREGMKVGVVVNDVAEANIDSEILQFEDADGIVGLQNGCVCCSGRDDLFARLAELVDSSGVSKLDKRWDRLVVECSGVAEPESIASELEAMGRRGEAVMRRIFLAGIVCVVDASTFWETYHQKDPGNSGHQPLSVLLVSQLESADTIVINKTDLVESSELKRLDQLLTALCPNARRLTTTQGAIAMRELLPADPVSLDMPAYVPTLTNRHSTAVRGAGRVFAPEPRVQEAHGGHGHVEEPQGHGHAEEAHGHGHGHGHAQEPQGHGHQGHGHAHAHSHDGADCSVCAAEVTAERHLRFGLTSFVYRRNGRRFDAARLAAALQDMPVSMASIGFAEDGASEGAAAAVRAAGAAAEREAARSRPFEGVMRSKGFLKVSGRGPSFYWSHAGLQLQVSEVEGGAQHKGPIQELVFIGTGMDQKAICETLDACLESDAPDAKAAL